MVDFDTNALLLADAGITVVAASVDSVETSVDLFDGMRLRYVKMVAEVDGPAVATSTGAAYKTGDPGFLHATGFLLNPAGEIHQSCYSTGPIGRMTCNDVMKVVEFVKYMESRQ